MSTALEYIRRIKDPEIRKKALTHCVKTNKTGYPDMEVTSISHAFAVAFTWVTTTEGKEYWQKHFNNPPELITP